MQRKEARTLPFGQFRQSPAHAANSRFATGSAAFERKGRALFIRLSRILIGIHAFNSMPLCIAAGGMQPLARRKHRKQGRRRLDQG